MRTQRPTVVFGWGFAASLALATAVTMVSVVEVRVVRDEITQLARTARRSTFLVGEVGRRISHLRAAAFERLLGHAAASADDAELDTIEAALQATVGELEPLLQEAERPRWQEFGQVLRRFRADVDRTRDASLARQTAPAREALVRELNALAARLQGELDLLGALNERENKTLLAEIDGRLAWTSVLESGLGGVLVVGLIAIWWMVARTIARQRRALEEHLVRIEQANRDLDAFAGRIAHDLKNALAPVSLGAATLRHAGGRPEMVARIAAQLERTVQLSRTLIDGLLAFSRHGEPRDRPETGSVPAAVASAVEQVRPLAEGLGATIDVDAPPLDVACPPALLHLVMANLISNAVKFLADRPVRHVRIRAQRVAECGELTVEDTGPGIPADALPRIFAPFYRVPGAAAGGTGIGLATVRRIVEAHGGAIDVESELSRGTTFRVRLPALRAPARRIGDAPAAIQA